MKQIIIAILLLGYFASVKAQTKLIVIYDENCEYCQDLLQNTYTNKEVIAKLNNYDKKMYEIKTEEAKQYVDNLGITSVHSQIFISDKDTAVINGFQEVKAQLQILDNPFAYIKNSFKYSRETTGVFYTTKGANSDLVITKLDMLRICSKMLGG